MDDVLRSVNEMRLRLASLHDELANEFGHHDTAPVGGFGMGYNTAVLTFELLSYYSDLWGRIDARGIRNHEQLRQENAERVALITKTLFITLLSGFEYSAKQALLLKPGALPLGKGRIYLWGIIQKSADHEWIGETEKRLWDGAIRLRNTLVHNNGVAEETRTYQFPGAQLELLDGAMVRGNLRLFPAVSAWVIEAFSRWCRQFHVA